MRRRRRAFSLIEVLVAVTIVVILLTLLMSAFRQVREQSNRAVCLSNLRQVGTALLNYVSDYDTYPGPSSSVRPHDWLYWQSNRNLQQSMIAPYLSGIHDRTLICPSDDMARISSANPYPYSYTVNEKMTGHYQPGITFGSVQRPAQKILVVCESADTLDDGCWCPANFTKDGRNVLSNRHDRTTEDPKNLGAGRGCAAFADGHAEFVERVLAQTPAYYDPGVP